MQYRSSCCRFLGNYSQALEDANRAVQLAPNDAVSHLALGMVHKETKNYKAAEASLSTAAYLDPYNASIQAHLQSLHGAKAQRSKGKKKEMQLFCCLLRVALMVLSAGAIR